MQTKRGYFITLEGCEGSGKSTQSEMLKKYLAEIGVNAVFTREPGGTPIAEKIRSIILDGNNGAMTDETEALLYAAARAQIVKEKILPLLCDGKVVVCDRYIDSSFAYQAYARGLSYDFIAEINSVAMKTCMPDLTIFFDITPEAAFRRKGGADADDRIEQSGIAFHNAVYRGYKSLAKKFPERIVEIDSEGDIDEIFSRVKIEIDKLLRR